MTLHGIAVPKERIAEFCRANGIRRLAFFGSILREDFRAGSDIDMLVEFQPGVRVGYFAVARMARELAALLGRSVDLRTPAELHPAFREEVVREALNEYVAA
jgi:predicted nucleotidyltransferase